MIPDWAIRTKSDELAIKQGAYFDLEKSKKILDFCNKYFRPQFISGEFNLLPWQERFLQNLHGWHWKDGTRRFRFANLHVAKKNGKTLLISLLAFYELFYSEEPSPYICAAAASLENASQVYKSLKFAIEQSPFSDYCHPTNHIRRITVPEFNAEFRCFASQGNRIHGEPCSLVLIDELHAISDPELFRGLRYNTDARKSGLCVAISTAGNNVNHFYHSIYEKSKRIISGEELDQIWYAEIHEADPTKNLEKKEQWYKANPSLSISFSEDQFRRDYESSLSNIGDKLNFMQKKLNIWVKQSEHSWLDVSDFGKYYRDIPDTELMKFPCVLSTDLSETIDPSSISIIHNIGDRNYYIKSFAFVCEEGNRFRQKTTLRKFDEFIAAKEMTITQGDMIDRDLIKKKILELAKQFKPTQINFDPTSAYVLMADIEAEGYSVGRVTQNFKNFNGPMVEFARAYKEGRIWHDNNQWLKYCLGNVRVEINKYGEIRPYKKICEDHIDGAVSTLLGFVSLFVPEPESQGLLLV